MAGLAGLALEKGYKVTGQDKAYYPPMSDQLDQLGILQNKTEEKTEDLKKCDVVIIGNSQSRGVESVEYVLNNNLKYFSGPEWIKKYILDDKFVFVISGTHGKTTTTSMLIKILQESKLNPSYLLGGIYLEEKISYKFTNSKYFIIEGDEYDTSFFDKRSKFVHYKPNTLVINNLEYDHSDIFENISQIQKQFHFLIRSMPGNSNIIYNNSDENVKKIISMGCWSKKNIYKKVDKIENIIGDHNLKNCGAAISAAETIGISRENSTKALEKFLGVKRRLERIKSKNFILYDDFAHHPTAITASIKALREKHKKGKINAFFEVSSNSMVEGTHKDNFLHSFSDADNIFIYCKKDVAWLKAIPSIDLYKDIDVVINKIKSSTENVDVVILMSNSDTTQIINKLK